MKHILGFTFTVLLFLFSTAHGGVGGMSGGSDHGKPNGISASSSLGTSSGSIYFQKDSTYISVARSNSLCLKGDTYYALLTNCLKTSENGCLVSEKKLASQPVFSTKLRCSISNRAENECQKWEIVPFVQKPTMKINIFDSHDRIIKTQTITVPTCNN